MNPEACEAIAEHGIAKFAEGSVNVHGTEIAHGQVEMAGKNAHDGVALAVQGDAFADDVG